MKKATGIYAEPLNTTSTMSRIIPRASPAAMPTMRRLIVRSSNRGNTRITWISTAFFSKKMMTGKG